MSWDKNTIVLSTIDSAVEVLNNLGAPYKLTLLGKVRGYGLNDQIHPTNEYPIRKLEYGNVVILEKMIRDNDCDRDDIIGSYTFRKEEEPLDWKIEEPEQE